MPQPIKYPCEVTLVGLYELPDHAAQLGKIVALSAALEALLGHLLAYLTRSSAAVTIMMFHSVTSTDAQRAMLTAAAEQILAGAQLDEFRDLMTEFRTRYGERSRLVHNLWGISPAHPGKAVWCQAKDSTRISSLVAGAETEEQLNLLAAEGGPLWKCCSTYTVADLVAVFDRLAAYTERVRLFVLKVQEEHPLFAPPEEAPSETPAIEPPRETGPDQNPG